MYSNFNTIVYFYTTFLAKTIDISCTSDYLRKRSISQDLLMIQRAETVLIFCGLSN